MNTPSQTSTLEEAVRAFAAEVKYWRETNALDKKALAIQMGFDPSYVSHIESCRHKPTEDFARKADEALNAGNTIWRRWRDYDAAKKHVPKSAGAPAPSPTVAYPGVDLVVEHDAARLDYDGRTYRPTMRRLLRNTGTDPITRYLIRISVDRYPGQIDRSNRHYRQNPLTWDELGLSATCQEEPMRWEVKLDMDSCKEAWLLFENDNGKFPLYPGQAVWITYNYSVGDNKWGHWFQRAVRLPTQRLEVQLAFPTALDPVVWGTETSMTADARPLATALSRLEEGAVAVFAWNTTQCAILESSSPPPRASVSHARRSSSQPSETLPKRSSLTWSRQCIAFAMYTTLRKAPASRHLRSGFTDAWPSFNRPMRTPTSS